MYSDAYGTTVPEDLLTSAAERAADLAAGMDFGTAARLAVRRLFCPCVCDGGDCGCLADGIVREVAARARARVDQRLRAIQPPNSSAPQKRSGGPKPA